MAEQPAGLGHLLIAERRVEQSLREVGAERAADLHGAERPAGAGAAAPLLDEATADRHAERKFDQAAAL